MADNGQQAVSLLTNALTAIGVGIGATMINSSLFTVDSGEKAVIYDRIRGGFLKETIGEGTHFLVPWLQKPYIVEIHSRPLEFSFIARTKDLQMVKITLRVLYRPDEGKLYVILQVLGTDYGEKVLPPIGNEVLKDVVAQFNADQLLTERPKFYARLRGQMIKRAKDFNIILDDVSITDLVYGHGFLNAVKENAAAAMARSAQVTEETSFSLSV